MTTWREINLTRRCLAYRANVISSELRTGLRTELRMEEQKVDNNATGYRSETQTKPKPKQTRPDYLGDNALSGGGQGFENYLGTHIYHKYA